MVIESLSDHKRSKDFVRGIKGVAFEKHYLNVTRDWIIQTDDFLN
jgi:hypothetical protein